MKGSEDKHDHKFYMRAAPSRYRLLVFFLFIFVLIGVLRVQTFFSFGDRDVGVFAYIGERILEGEVPYRDIWDHKTPLIYFLNALLFQFFGTSFRVLAIFEVFWLTLTSYALYKLARLWLQEYAAYAVTGIFAVYAGATYLVGSFGMTETYALLPTILGVYYAFLFVLQKRPRFAFYSGVMVSMAFLFRQTAGVIGIVIGLYLLYVLFKGLLDRRNSIFAIKMFVMGIVVPLFTLLLYFYSNGGASDAISQIFTFNFIYSDGIGPGILQNAKTLILELIYTVGRWPLILALSLAGILFVMADAFKFPVVEKSKEELSLEVFTVVWFMMDLFAIIYSGEFYRHYFVQSLVSASLLSGIVLNRYYTSSVPLSQSLAVFILLFLFATPLFSATHANLRFALNIDLRLNGDDVVYLDNRAYISDQKQYIEWVFENTHPEDYLYWWGAEARLNFLTGKLNPTKLIYTYPLFTDGYASEELVQGFITDLEKQPPRFIIDTSSTNKKVPSFMSEQIPDVVLPAAEFIRDHYSYLEKVGEWEIYTLSK